MNHIANIADIQLQQPEAVNNSLRINDYLTAAAMMLYSVLMYGMTGVIDNLPALTIVSTLVYGLAVYIYYGTAMLAWRKHTYFLWGAITTAVIVGYFSSGLTNTWNLLTGFSMFLFAGAIIGRLNLGALPPMRIYLIGATAVTVFAIAQNMMVWPEQMQMIREGIALLMTESQTILQSQYTAEEISKLQSVLSWTAGLLPATVVVSSLLQFSIAYLLFLTQLKRISPETHRLTPFYLWKMPFGFTAVVMTALAIRFLGVELFTLVSDNILAAMVIFYSVTGIALVEFMFRRFQVPILARLMFYLFVALTQVLGLVLLAFIGFVDSFADWRSKQMAAAAASEN